MADEVKKPFRQSCSLDGQNAYDRVVLRNVLVVVGMTAPLQNTPPSTAASQ